MTVPRRTIVSGSKAWICCRCRALSTANKPDVIERRPSQKLPTTPARTRFAPSPTGYLHLGSLRTALFNYLTAKATGGKFVLRIEDTDKKRIVDDAESRLYQDLKWAGLQWDEGPDIGGPYGPYKQSERTSMYQSHAEKLLRSGHAYRCFCSTERLKSLAMGRNGLGLSSDYDRTCTSLPAGESEERASKGEQHVVRLKLPEVPPTYTDLVYGVVGQRKSKEGAHAPRPQLSFEDPILIKSDGHPTYHLANVVDDHHMGITHVIRAVEWMPSTPKHIVMYNAFDWKPPTFAHVGLLQDASRQKFSKRNLALDINSFRQDGIFPEALVNYVALFGWSHRLGVDQLNLQDLVQNFDLKFTKGNTIAAPNKLFHLQKQYAQQYAEKEEGEEYLAMIDKVLAVAEEHLQAHPESRIYSTSELKERIAALLNVDAKNYTTPLQFVERNAHFFFIEPRDKYRHGPNDAGLTENTGRIADHLKASLPEQWDELSLREAFDNMANTLSTESGPNSEKASRASVQHFLRWALTGGRPGPTLILTMSILGRDVSLKRIEDATAVLEKMGFEANKRSA